MLQIATPVIALVAMTAVAATQAAATNAENCRRVGRARRPRHLRVPIGLSQRGNAPPAESENKKYTAAKRVAA
jgi:hypothetical protein